MENCPPIPHTTFYACRSVTFLLIGKMWLQSCIIFGMQSSGFELCMCIVHTVIIYPCCALSVLLYGVYYRLDFRLYIYFFLHTQSTDQFISYTYENSIREFKVKILGTFNTNFCCRNFATVCRKIVNFLPLPTSLINPRRCWQRRYRWDGCRFSDPFMY